MSSKLLSHRAALCNIVKRIAVEAGELTLEYFDGLHDMDEDVKADGSPVTVADHAAEQLIAKRLHDILPDVLVVGEETYGSLGDIDFSEHTYFWLVDPIDGTKAFIRGSGEFTVNIALIQNGAPVLGVIYAPEKGELYAGYTDDNGQGVASRFFEESETEKNMRTRHMPKNGLVVMSSAYHGTVDMQSKFLEQFKVNKIKRCSSSLKICMVANGKADIYPRFGPTCEWDTAAGHAILLAAGGDIVDECGDVLRYGVGRSHMLNPNMFICASRDVLAHMAFP